MNRPPKRHPFQLVVLLLCGANELLGVLHDLPWY
jgi:hypothetical protein